jgi:hypothetical protein
MSIWRYFLGSERELLFTRTIFSSQLSTLKSGYSRRVSFITNNISYKPFSLSTIALKYYRQEATWSYIARKNWKERLARIGAQGTGVPVAFG